MWPNCKRSDAWVIRKGLFARSTFAKRKPSANPYQLPFIVYHNQRLEGMVPQIA